MNQEADKLVGARLQNRFDIISILGTGASSTVYKANHLLLDQLVAIKVLHSSHCDSQTSQQRFQKEASVLNSFKHPNIVRFFSYGNTDDGRNFMVLEFLEGKTLAQILKEKEALTVEEAMPIFKDVCNGLSYAHEHDVIHRDLKPGNIINVSGEDNKTLSKILDFGVAKTPSEDLSMTKTGTLIGSANYMSPEQCSSKELGKTTDIYSMGCLMYETMVGSAPMQAESDLLTMSNHLNKTVKNVPAKHGISRELERVILRCLEKDPKKRFGSSNELLSALEAAEGTPIARAPKHKGMLIGLACGFVAILITSAGFIAGKKNNDLAKVDKKQSEHQLRLLKLRKTKRPEPEHNLEGLKLLDDWIEANVVLKNMEPVQLWKAYHDASSIRAELGIEELSPKGTKIEQLLKQKIASLKRLDPTESESKNVEKDLGDLQCLLGEKEAATATYNALLMKRPNEDNEAYLQRQADVYASLIAIDWSNRDFKQLLKHLEIREKALQEIEDQETLIALYISRASVYRELGESAEANKEAQKARNGYLELEKRDHRDAMERAGALMHLLNQIGESKQAVEIAQLALKDWDDSGSYSVYATNALLEMALAYKQQGNQKKAGEIFEKLVIYLKSKNHFEQSREMLRQTQVVLNKA